MKFCRSIRTGDIIQAELFEPLTLGDEPAPLITRKAHEVVRRVDAWTDRPTVGEQLLADGLGITDYLQDLGSEPAHIAMRMNGDEPRAQLLILGSLSKSVGERNGRIGATLILGSNDCGDFKCERMRTGVGIDEVDPQPPRLGVVTDPFPWCDALLGHDSLDSIRDLWFET
jgi:hypothetical protein